MSKRRPSSRQHSGPAARGTTNPSSQNASGEDPIDHPPEVHAEEPREISTPTRSKTAGGDAGRRAAVNGVASIAVTSVVVNAVLKPLARRRRPQRAVFGVPIGRRVRMPRSHSSVGSCRIRVRVREWRRHRRPPAGDRAQRARGGRRLLAHPHRRSLPRRRARWIGHGSGDRAYDGGRTRNAIAHGKRSTRRRQPGMASRNPDAQCPRTDHELERRAEVDRDFGCDAAYPDFCIASPPQDLECPDPAGRRTSPSGSPIRTTSTRTAMVWVASLFQVRVGHRFSRSRLGALLKVGRVSVDQAFETVRTTGRRAA